MNQKPVFLICGIMVLILACACPSTPLWSATRVPSPTATRQPVESPGLSPFLPSSLSPEISPFLYDWNDRTPFASNLVSAAQLDLPVLHGATIYHLAFSFSDLLDQASGLEEIFYTNTETIPLEEIDLALLPNLLGGKLDIQHTIVNGTEVIPTIQDWLLRIPITPSLHPGDTLTLHLEFTVEIPSSGGDLYFGIFGFNNDILSFAHGYPTVLVHNSEGWNNQVPDLDGDPLFSDSSFYLVGIDAPGSLSIVASGNELEHINIGDRQQILFADGPARDFYLSASSNLPRVSNSWQYVTVNSYYFGSSQTAAQEALQIAIKAIEIFSQRYGTYRYTEFDIVPIVTSAGGVEFPGITAVSDNLYLFGDFLETVVVHETAHMWFYNLVGNDTLDQPWLDESLAQFATWQYFLDRYGDSAARDFMEGDLQLRWDLASDPSIPIGLPVDSYDNYDYDAIIYGRGAFFFMELRRVLGVDEFDDFMRDYVVQFSWDIATTQGFQLLAENHCVCNLTPLFAEWVNP